MKKRFLFLSSLLALSLSFSVSALESAQGSAKPCPLKALKDGREIPWSSLKGKVVYLDFWASWCGPCAQSFPFMAEISKKHKKEGLEVVAISVDENQSEAETFMAQHPSDLQIAHDPDGHCPREYGLETMPTSYLIDRKGQLRHVHRGFARADRDEIARALETLLKESP